VEYFERMWKAGFLCLQGEIQLISRRAFMPDICEQSVRPQK
jgi:hypothetical protein